MSGARSPVLIEVVDGPPYAHRLDQRWIYLAFSTAQLLDHLRSVLERHGVLQTLVDVDEAIAVRAGQLGMHSRSLEHLGREMMSEAQRTLEDPSKAQVIADFRWRDAADTLHLALRQLTTVAAQQMPRALALTEIAALAEGPLDVNEIDDEQQLLADPLFRLAAQLRGVHFAA